MRLSGENAMLRSISFDICNLDHIYNTSDGFEYSLPRPLLEEYLSGIAFDNKEVYSEQESQNLREDIEEIFKKIMSKNPIKDSSAIMTAGGPGAGKTTKLRQDLKEALGEGKKYAYICPDDVCLRKQKRTYKKEIDDSDTSILSRQNAYNKWRPGSNAASHLILANLIREKCAFYFGTTSTGPKTYKLFELLKKQGYRIKLLHISAPDEVRWESIKERDKTFVQTTEEDVLQKGLLLPQRILDTYLKYADEIRFYLRTQVDQGAELAATWIRNEDTNDLLGTLEIVSAPRYEKIKEIHNAVVEKLQLKDLDWETAVEKNSLIA